MAGVRPTLLRCGCRASGTVKKARWSPTRAFATARGASSGPARGDKVFACMSGGVDSAVAARLLLDQGYDVRPVFMRNWDTLDASSSSGGCEWERDYADVQQVCADHLGGLEPELVDLSREYWTDVFEEALAAWRAGTTPNPDVDCNKRIKFGRLAERLLRPDEVAWLATGHYARVERRQGRAELHRARHLDKDQSYYLSTVPQVALERTLFPLGGLRKSEVKELAREWGMKRQLERKESMGVCFVGKQRSFAHFLDGYLAPHEGPILLPSGKQVGRHSGLWNYTIGQSARVGGLPQRMFVGAKDAVRNTVTICEKSDPLLWCVELVTADFEWRDPSRANESIAAGPLHAQTRSLEAQPKECTVMSESDGSLRVRFEAPAEGVAPGQVVVLYEGDRVLGGGTIAEAVTLSEWPRAPLEAVRTGLKFSFTVERDHSTKINSNMLRSAYGKPESAPEPSAQAADARETARKRQKLLARLRDEDAVPFAFLFTVIMSLVASFTATAALSVTGNRDPLRLGWFFYLQLSAIGGQIIRHSASLELHQPSKSFNESTCLRFLHFLFSGYLVLRVGAVLFGRFGASDLFSDWQFCTVCVQIIMLWFMTKVQQKIEELELEEI